MGNNGANYQPPYNCRIMISFGLQRHSGVVHMTGELSQMDISSSGKTGFMQRSAQRFAMGSVMSQSSACGQGEEGKATQAMLC